MQPPAVSTPNTRVSSPERWVQAFVCGKTDLAPLPDRPDTLRCPARQWFTRWRGLTRPERLRLIQLLGAIGDALDAERLLTVGEAIEDDPNVAPDWRETILTAIDAAFFDIETRLEDERRLAETLA